MSDPGADESGDSGATNGQVNRAEGDLAPAPEVTELNEKLLRALADAENARKRADRARSEGREAGIAELAASIIPALDSLKLAIDATRPAEQEQDAQTHVEAILEGLRATNRAFLSAFMKVGVNPISPARGDLFDPNLHDAIASRPDSEAEHGQVLETVQSGYKVGDRLIRPARVVIASAG